MTRKPFCTEGTWEGAVIPHMTLWKRRVGYPKPGEHYEDNEENLLYEETASDPYDRYGGKVTVFKVKQTTLPGQVCPDCGTKVCGDCGYGIDKEGQRNDECCDSPKVAA